MAWSATCSGTAWTGTDFPVLIKRSLSQRTARSVIQNAQAAQTGSGSLGTNKEGMKEQVSIAHPGAW